MRLFFTRETLGWYHEVVFTRETLRWYHEVVFHSRDSRVVPLFSLGDSRGTMRLFSLARLSGGTMRLFSLARLSGGTMRLFFTRETLGWYHEVVFHSRDSRVVP